MSARSERMKGLIVLGSEVEVQDRLNDDSPVVGRGKISKVEKEDLFEVTLSDGEVVRFNSHGICMPWGRQLQIKIPSQE